MGQRPSARHARILYARRHVRCRHRKSRAITELRDRGLEENSAAHLLRAYLVAVANVPVPGAGHVTFPPARLFAQNRLQVQCDGRGSEATRALGSTLSTCEAFVSVKGDVHSPQSACVMPQEVVWK